MDPGLHAEREETSVLPAHVCGGTLQRASVVALHSAVPLEKVPYGWGELEELV